MLGDFRTDSLSPYFTSKPLSAVDYHYDVNGNLTRDLNKDIGSSTADGIIYNHLNLPWQITFRSKTGTKGTITYIYDAAGNKLKKTTLDSAGNLQTVTTYIGPFQYQGRQALGGSGTPADTLKFFGQQEGRVRLETDTANGQTVNSWKYDYFLKDHLGNTRMVLTDEQETDQYPAVTMEVGDSSLENLYYTNLDETRVALPPGYPTDTTTKPNNYVAELYSADNNPVIGPGIVLKVMAGDQFSIKTSSWYQSSAPSPVQVPNPASDVVSALIAGVSHIPGEGAAAGAMSSSPTLTPNMANFLADTGSIDETKPHAFLNWILFDNQFNYVAASSGFQQVGAAGIINPMIQTNLPVSSSGFLYIYVSNTTPNVPVFFDNLQVTHVRGPLLEEDHYYPFGLSMAGISDQAFKSNFAVNKYRFQKQELQNKEFSDGSGLEMYEFKYRMDDLQLGRFWSVDPLANKYVYNSPYAFSEDKVIGHIELEGLEAVPLKHSNNPYIRALADKNLQKHEDSFIDNARGSVKVTLTIGPGIGYEEKVGKSGTKVELKGPSASISMNGAGEISAEGSAASVTATGTAGKVSGEVAAKVGVVTYEDDKVKASPAKVEYNINVTSGDEKKSTSGSASNESVTYGGHFGMVGVGVSVAWDKTKAAFNDFFSTVGDYFKSSANEANDSFFGHHGKPE